MMTPYPEIKRRRLKPAGHSSVIESLIQPAIVIGSTLMSAIAAYVLALDEIGRILNGTATATDVFIVVLCAGMGFLIDMAIIVSATRYKMHAVRADPRERRWLTLAKWVLGIGLASETLTLFYFFVHLSAAAFPPPLVRLADLIHAVLAISRAFLPPVVIAYFAAGVLPVMFDRADRNREIKSRTSSNIMLLIDRLSEVYETDDKAELLRALGGQLMLDTYATYDETARTSEDQQLGRDAKLLTHLSRIHRLDWSAIAADVAPELTAQHTPAVPALPAPSPESPVRTPAELPVRTQSDATPDGDDDRPPTGGGTPIRKSPVRTPHNSRPKAPSYIELEAPPEWKRKRAARGSLRAVRTGGKRTAPAVRRNVEADARAVWRDGMTIGELMFAATISRTTAAKYRAKFQEQDDKVRQVAQ